MRLLQRLGLAVMLVNFVLSGAFGMDALAHESVERLGADTAIHHVTADQHGDETGALDHAPSDHHKQCQCCLSASTPALPQGAVSLAYRPKLLGVVTRPADSVGQDRLTAPPRRPPRSVA